MDRVTQLFDRRWKVEVGRVDAAANEREVFDVSGLDLEFDVAKDVTRAPNKATIKIWNLSPEKRGLLASAVADSRRLDATRKPFVRLEAGYAEQGMSQLFRGVITAIRAERSSVDTLVTIEAKDASEVMRSSRLSQSFARGTSIEAVLRAAASALGVGEGNLSRYAQGIALDGERIFREGYAAHGLATETLDAILRAAGFRWSVQDNALQVRPANGAAEERILVVSPGTGLIGSPAAEDRGQVSIEALLQPGLHPGARVELRSADFRGVYAVREARYQGVTNGNTWQVNCLLRPE